MGQLNYLPLVAVVLLTACARETPTAEQRQMNNQYALRNPEYIGQFPDGTTVHHASVRVEGSSYPQEIFYVTGANTITANAQVSAGKGTQPQVAATRALPEEPTVVIDGQHIPVSEIRAMIVRDEDQRRNQKGKQ